MYIIFEGIVGSGKTTQSKKLHQYLTNSYPNKEVLWTFEPGGSEIGLAIRKVVQGTRFKEEMDPVCEAYLYASSRAQVLRRVVKPVLDKGGIVISDRSFITSMVFQGTGRNLGVDSILKINETAIEGFVPDVVLYFNLDVETGLQRLKRDGQERLDDDKFEAESLEFFENLKIGYTKVSKMPVFKDKWITIDANGTVDEIFDRMTTALENHL